MTRSRTGRVSPIVDMGEWAEVACVAGSQDGERQQRRTAPEMESERVLWKGRG